MKKLTLFALALALSVATYLYAADNVGQSSGVSRSFSPSRWQVTKAGAEANSGSLATTNVVSAVSSVIGKIVFVPGAMPDVLKVYNAATGASATAGNLIFEVSANSPTMINSGTVGNAGSYIYDFTPGWSATSGIVTIITRPTNTATGSKAYIGWDSAQ